METLFADNGASAEFSPCKTYRYTLTREWADGSCIAWLMFNPSVADEFVLDPTVRRCVGFSKRWGFGRLIILNLYAVRNPDPRAVTRMGVSAVGPMNDYWILESAREACEIVCAWGCAQHAPEIDARIDHILSLVRAQNPEVSMTCLGYRKDQHPRHPLMVAYDTPRVDFRRLNGSG